MPTPTEVFEALESFEAKGAEGSSLIAVAVLALAFELRHIREELSNMGEELADIRVELRNRREPKE